MTIDLILIFVLIGLAHWAAHVLNCPGCKSTLDSNVKFLLEGVIATFGWPLDAIGYVHGFFKKKGPGPTVAEIEQHAKEAVDKFFAARGEGGFNGLTIAQEEDESEEDFQRRIFKTIGEHQTKLKRERGLE